jgi:hypothetical protein
MQPSRQRSRKENDLRVPEDLSYWPKGSMLYMQQAVTRGLGK